MKHKLAAEAVIFGNSSLDIIDEGWTVNTKIKDITNVQEVVSMILINFNRTGERAFIIFTEEHAFNAVVIGKKEDATVIFVDAWKTHKYIFSADEIAKKYKDQIFRIWAHSGHVTPLAKPEKTNNISPKP